MTGKSLIASGRRADHHDYPKVKAAGLRVLIGHIDSLAKNTQDRALARTLITTLL
ncbi:MAG: hypothetical protein HQ526_06850 [Actinobacteria bacterium]|nr:hypothetical protein [Actinomycetota bacterium]